VIKTIKSAKTTDQLDVATKLAQTYINRFGDGFLADLYNFMIDFSSKGKTEEFMKMIEYQRDKIKHIEKLNKK